MPRSYVVRTVAIHLRFLAREVLTAIGSTYSAMMTLCREFTSLRHGLPHWIPDRAVG